MKQFLMAHWSNLIMTLGSAILTLTKLARGNGSGAAIWACVTIAQLAIIYKRYKDHSNR